ncbi:hypothetical protein ACJX0J_033434, partial [Zea mays]
MGQAMEDDQFTTAQMGPRFRPMWRKEAMLALDSRFTSMMTDQRSSRTPCCIAISTKRTWWRKERRKRRRRNRVTCMFCTKTLMKTYQWDFGSSDWTSMIAVFAAASHR